MAFAGRDCNGEGPQTLCCWVEELLPVELLSLVLGNLPKEEVAVAARTCRRWYACSPAGLRQKLSLRWAAFSLNTLRWARANGWPWKEETCLATAWNGTLEALKWARESGCPWDERTCAFAAAQGQLEVLKWARENRCPWDERTIVFAAEKGRLNVLQWARENGCPWDQQTCTEAARNGHLDALQWAREQGCPWDQQTCTKAAENGHLEVLQWARANGCPWDAGTAAVAAKNGHLEVLRWAKENGCAWDQRTCTDAARNGHLEVLKWARANGCPLGPAGLCQRYPSPAKGVAMGHPIPRHEPLEGGDRLECRHAGRFGSAPMGKRESLKRQREREPTFMCAMMKLALDGHKKHPPTLVPLWDQPSLPLLPLLLLVQHHLSFSSPFL